MKNNKLPTFFQENIAYTEESIAVIETSGNGPVNVMCPKNIAILEKRAKQIFDSGQINRIPDVVTVAVPAYQLEAAKSYFGIKDV